MIDRATMSTASAVPLDGRTVPTDEHLLEDPRFTRLLRDALLGVGEFAGANVIMQLSRLPVGRGVAESRVESGRLDRHPFKRARTTGGFLAIALLGTEAEQRAVRDEVNRQHRQVRSRPGDPVAYNAFDADLQLWVAACLYRGFDDYLRLYRAAEYAPYHDAFYRHAARLGTTLQMPVDRWPADRAAFERYWDAAVAEIRLDEVTRTFLQGFARTDFLPAPLRRVVGPPLEALAIGHLPGPFREALGIPWTPALQRRFRLARRLLRAVDALVPRPLLLAPVTVGEWDVRRRLHAGRPFV